MKFFIIKYVIDDQSGYVERKIFEISELFESEKKAKDLKRNMVNLYVKHLNLLQKQRLKRLV